MQTTIVGSPSFSDAAVMVEACYTELLRAGFVKEADSIRGAEIYSEASVGIVLSELVKIKHGIRDSDVSATVWYAIAMLRSLLRQEPVLAAAS